VTATSFSLGAGNGQIQTSGFWGTLITAGTGVYGQIIRDGGIVEHLYKTIESGSSSTTVNYTSHGLSVGDFFWNVTRDAYSYVTSKTTNSFNCESITSQASGDTIEVYIEANTSGRNIIKRQGKIPKEVQFTSFTCDFETMTKLTVSLTEMAVNGIYCIDEVNIKDKGNNYFECSVRAVLRAEDNFSTQRPPNYVDFFKGF
jgi:hypothetical protein